MSSPRLAVGVIAACGYLLLATGAAQAQTSPVGFVKIAAGSTSVIRGGQVLSLSVGEAVLRGDTLRTGARARLGVTLRDDTRVSLGPEAQLSITDFLFEPAEGQLGLVLRLARGVLDYVSGRIATLAPGSIRIETPATIVGVRGTHLLIEAAP